MAGSGLAAKPAWSQKFGSRSDFASRNDRHQERTPIGTLEGLLITLNQGEVENLMAYLLSGGNRYACGGESEEERGRGAVERLWWPGRLPRPHGEVGAVRSRQDGGRAIYPILSRPSLKIVKMTGEPAQTQLLDYQPYSRRGVGYQSMRILVVPPLELRSFRSVGQQGHRSRTQLLLLP